MEPIKKETVRVTQVLDAVRQDTPGSKEELFRLVYDELRRLAGAVRGGRDNKAQGPAGRGTPTLQTTALVHEAFVRLVGSDGTSWENRRHFMAIAARAMRAILVDLARSRGAAKRGGDRLRVTFDEDLFGEKGDGENLVLVHEALEKLEEVNPRWVRVVELRFFAGLEHEAVANVLEVSEPTVRRDWRAARAWLYRELGG